MLSRGLLHNLYNKICGFDLIILSIQTHKSVGVLLKGGARREIAHSSQSELLLNKCGSAVLMRLREAVISAGRGAGLLMPLPWAHL